MHTTQRTILSFLFIFLISLSLFADAEVGKLVIVNGDVRIVSVQNQERKAGPNDPVYNNDTVKTVGSSSAKILFTDQSIMDVGANSALKVSDYMLKGGDDRTGTFSLIYGKIRSLISTKVGPQGKVEVRSGDTVMGVRGTEFVVDKPANSTAGSNFAPTLTVVTGSVEIFSQSGGSPIMVTAGQMIIATPQAFASTSTSTSATSSTATGADGKKDSTSSESSSSVIQVSAEKMQTTLETAKTEDNTFVAAVAIGTGASGNENTSSLTNLVAAAGSLPPPPPIDSATINNMMQSGFLGTNTNTFLPPVSIAVGNQVHLSVKIQ